MTLYAIIAPQADPRLQVAINRVFPNKNFEFAGGQFVASAPGLTAQQVALLLGDDSAVGRYVVFPFVSFWGVHRKDLWEWLTANAG
jgi:hypothetical protein